MIFRYYRDADGKLQDGIVLPKSIDNRDTFPPILNQGDKPWCAAYSISQICEALIWKHYGKLVALDEEALYKEAKRIDGMDCDGTSLEAAIQAAFNLGSFDGKVVACPVKCSRDSVKRALHKHGILHCGLQITAGWCRCRGPYIPASQWQEPLGGHAVCLVGYSDDGVVVANSWGPEWGCNGFSELAWDEFEREAMCVFGIEVK